MKGKCVPQQFELFPSDLSWNMLIEECQNSVEDLLSFMIEQHLQETESQPLSTKEGHDV